VAEVQKFSSDKKESNTSADEEILRAARERFRLAEEAYQSVRELGLDDLKFRAGEQWPDNIRNERIIDQRPCLVINRIPQYVRQITNDQRQNRPSIKVMPVDDKADVKTAKVLQGIIRYIENNSNADIAYDTAFEGTVIKGFGYYRVLTDFCDPYSFDQDLLIKKVPDDFKVYLDPFHKEPDGSDAKWGFIFDDISKDTFKADYPKAEMSSMDDWESIGDRTSQWVKRDSVRVAEYFYTENKEITLVLLSDGNSADKDTFDKDENGEIILPLDITVVDERKSLVPVVKWCKINGYEVLKETIWPGRWIPIIPVYGDELNIDGRKILEGIVRHAKDPQRMYNYWVSTETEMIALAPRAPYIVAEGQITEDYEPMWRMANRKNFSYLPYKQTDHMGQIAPPPQRNVYEAPVQSITNARLQSSEDIKTTTGIYDSSLGNRSNESSGVAIQRRANQAQTANFHFIDNLTRSLRHCGRVLLDAIPIVYDTKRALRILGDNNEQELVTINEIFNGKDPIYTLGIGKYDVVVETGPSFATRRQEAAETILEFIRVYPAAAPLIGDLLAKNFDWPEAQEISERLKKTLPPGILDDKDKSVPPEVQAQIAQLTQALEQMKMENMKNQEIIGTKVLELESKERIEFAKIEADLKKELFKAQAQNSQAILEAEIMDAQNRQALVGINVPIQMEANDQIPDQDFGQLNQPPTGGPSPGEFMGE